jgi:PleD family two-component response regulator
MNEAIICPYCQLPQQITRKPSDPPGEVCCPNYGGAIPWRPQAPARPTTVLWIDDDRLVLGPCAPVLERRGYRVLIAAGGVAAIATARQAHPDAVLLDIMMSGMTGFEVCQQLRADAHLKFPQSSS